MSAQRKAWLRRRLERGGVAVIVAVMLGCGVLLGSAALALDVGNLMSERRQLQNGADAAVAQLARLCSDKSNLSKCNPTLAATVTAVNGANKANLLDGTASLDDLLDFSLGTKNGMCGRVPGSTSLPACPSATTTANVADLKLCPPLPDAVKANTAIKYVEVYTLTDDAKSSKTLSSYFLSGKGGKVSACARMAWGPPGAASTLPLTFAECEYQEAIATYGFGNDPIDPADKYKGETSLPLKYAKNQSCDPGTVSSGGDFDGGFGWLSTNTGCVATTQVPHWYDGQTGVGGGSGCYDKFLPGTKIYIPIFSCISDTPSGTDNPCNQGSPSGTHTYYYIRGYAAFFVTGVDITGPQKNLLPGYPGTTAQNECNKESKDNKCIYGWFLSDWVDYGGDLDLTGTVPDYGANVFKPIG